MAKLSDLEIKNKLKNIEDKIKFKKNFTRTDIQNALDEIYGQGLSPSSKCQILKSMVDRTGIKDIGIRTVYKPRENLKEVDKTYDFIKDIYSYKGVLEGDNGKEGKKT